MFATTHEGGGMRLVPRHAALAETRSFGERAFRVSKKALIIAAAGAVATAAIIAVRIGLYAIGHPDHPLYRTIVQIFG